MRTDLDWYLQAESGISLSDLLDPKTTLTPLASLWDSWRTAVAAAEDGRTVFGVAHQLGMKWPGSRRGELLLKWAEFSFVEVRNRPGIGSKKLRRLLACMAAAYLTLHPEALESAEELTPVAEEGSGPSSLAMSLDIDEFIADPRPATLPEEVWDFWRSKIQGSSLADVRISDIAPLADRTWPSSRSSETLSQYASISLRRFVALHGIGAAKRKTLFACFALAVKSIDEGFDLLNDYSNLLLQRAGLELDGRPPEASVRQLVAKFLPSRLQKVVRLRFGFKGMAPFSLQEVGSEIGVGRERVRQLEVKALQQLAQKPGILLLNYALESSEERIWAALASDLGVVNGATRPLNRRAWHESGLPGELYLALRIHHKSVNDWLDTFATKARGGWYRAAVSQQEIQSARQKLRKAKRHLLLPALLESVVSSLGIEEEHARLAIAFDSGFRLLGNAYLTDGRSTSRQRRAVRLHVLLFQEFLDSLTPTLHVFQRYQEVFPGDARSYRDVHISLCDAPHLFLEVGGTGWTPLAPSDWAPPDLDSLRPPVRDAAEPLVEEEAGAAPGGEDLASAADDESITSRLEEFLRCNGPLHLSELVEQFQRENPGLASTSSLAPFLILSGRFRRLAPGYWGLPEHQAVLDPVDSHDPNLLHKKHVRNYARARYAGDPMDQFPLWTPAMECEWCVWAQHNAPDALFHSLMSVVDPAAWPGSAELRQHWHRQKELHGRYRLQDKPKYRLKEKLPRLVDILEGAYYLRVYGRIHWMAANRIAGKRHTSHSAASLLSIWIAAGAAAPSEHWQQPHVCVAAGAGQLIDRLSGELHSTGTLQWKSDAGRDLLLQLKSHGPLGWVDSEELGELVDKLLDGRGPATVEGTASQDDTEEGVGEIEDAFLAELQAARRRAQSKRLLGQLRSDAADSDEAPLSLMEIDAEA